MTIQRPVTIGDHAEQWRPERLAKRHRHLAAVGSASKVRRARLVGGVDRERKPVETRLAEHMPSKASPRAPTLNDACITLLSVPEAACRGRLVGRFAVAHQCADCVLNALV